MVWDKKDISPELVKDLSARYGCDLLVASILARRGVTAGETVRYFLEDDPRYLRNPFEFPGMEDAVDRILSAKEEGEKLLVFGDRDVDGITATTLLVDFFKKLEIDVSWRFPVGNEPYGLSIEAVEDFAAEQGTLIVTVDCGISCLAEIARANELGIDVIVTDHHNQQETLPDALAVINPKLNGSPYPFRDLSGCGVAYKLASALRFALKSDLYGHSVSLLNTRPSNDAYIIEAVKLRNLAVIDRLAETVIPGMVGIAETRLPAFLEGQQIFAWDAPLQKKTLSKIFGSGIEVYMIDMAGEIGKDIPQAAGKSLLRLREISRIAKYSEKPAEEMDVFVNLFTSFFRKREKHFTGDDIEDMQLAALGTMADLMPLRDENRIIVRIGMKALQEKPRPGLSDLIFKLGLSGRRLGAVDISWQLCPAINAAGRMGQPETAAKLLMEEDLREREKLAEEIVGLNEQRKTKGEETWAIVEPMAQESLDGFGGKLALACGENIIRGVTGIMANRLVNRFKVPAVVVSFCDGTATGSLRSTRGYDLAAILDTCADLFIDKGGHNYAAGFSMDYDETEGGKSNWREFLSRLKTIASNIELKDGPDGDTVSIDAELPLSYLKPDIIFKIIDRLEPYGEENKPLTFLSKNLPVEDISLMGTGKNHVKLTLDAGECKWPAIYWQAPDWVRDINRGDRLDLAFQVNRNYFKGNEIPQMIIAGLNHTGRDS
ncbi:MAG: single-stranded-DNA-specific exonuclease RecJ [Treponema sp.]|jgi:single-stranded-DNA-specific exonuclease|nr:single-stranded-DNA-specific exonuclease RecJ [Treponema sp.]